MKHWSLIFFLLLQWGGASDKTKLYVLLKMLPEQKTYYEKSIFPDFEKENRCEIMVLDYQDDWSLNELLKKSDLAIDLVKVPMGMSRQLVDENLMRPMESIVDSQALWKLKESYFLSNLGKVEDSLYYLPRKFETRIMVYLKTKVNDAQVNWQKHRTEINESLIKANYNGLPADYVLELDPAEWDWFDLFVVGYYWKLKSNGEGKIAHRGKDYSGTSLGLIDRMYSMGAEAKDIAVLENPYFMEILKWESLFSTNNIYNHKMWTEGWSGENLWEPMGHGQIFLSFLTQIDCYFLQGSGDKKYLTTVDELGFSVMPTAVTLSDYNTRYKRTTTGGWFWGIPRQAQKPALSLKLLDYLTQTEIQIRELNRFGMIPVRKEILVKSSLGLEDKWKTKIFQTSFKQLQLNKKTRLPNLKDLEKLEKRYVKIWKSVVSASVDNYLDEKDLKKMVNP